MNFLHSNSLGYVQLSVFPSKTGNGATSLTIALGSVVELLTMGFSTFDSDSDIDDTVDKDNDDN